MVLSGHVRNGMIVLDDPVELADGTVVTVSVADQAASCHSGNAGLRQVTKNGLPVVLVPDPTPPIDPALIRQALEEEGF